MLTGLFWGDGFGREERGRAEEEGGGVEGEGGITLELGVACDAYQASVQHIPSYAQVKNKTFRTCMAQSAVVCRLQL